MIKYRFYDGAAVTVALLLLVIVCLALPNFWSIWIKVGIGLIFAVLVMAAYLVIRTPDKVIALEEQLYSIARYAERIGYASKHLASGAWSLQEDLDLVSVTIAKLSVKILERDFKRLEVEIRRLVELSRSFVSIMAYFTKDGVYLRPNEQKEKVVEAKNNQIPKTLETLQEISVAVDANLAKSLASDEAQLEFVQKLYEKNSKAQKALDLLETILEPKKGVSS